MQTILFLLNELDEISHSRMVLKIVSYLDKKRFSPYVYSLRSRGSLLGEFQSILKDHFYVSSGNILIDVLRIRKVIKNLSNCIVQTPAVRSDYVIFLVKILLFGNYPFYHVAVRHNYFFQNNSLCHFFKNILYFFSCRFVDKNVCVAKHIGEKIINELKISPQKVSTIVNGADYSPVIKESNRIKQSLKLKKGIPIILYIGSLSPRKNLTVLIEALSRIQRNYYCIIIGEGEEQEKIGETIKGKNLAEKIMLLGPQKNVDDYLNLADIFVMPSLDEGLSLSIIEAMHAGLPCVVSNIDGNRELIEHMQNGVIFSAQNKDECTSSILSLLKNRKLRRELGKKARYKANKLYSEESMLVEYQRLYGDVLKEISNTNYVQK